MLIPEQAKSTWQPIKSWELCSSFAFQRYCLWCAGECLYWPMFQMSHSRNTLKACCFVTDTVSGVSQSKSREHVVTERGWYRFYSLFWKRTGVFARTLIVQQSRMIRAKVTTSSVCCLRSESAMSHGLTYQKIQRNGTTPVTVVNSYTNFLWIK